jgi:acyl-CoA oxidase
MENAMAVVEMARVDASVATFFLVHNFLALITVGLLVRR